MTEIKYTIHSLFEKTALEYPDKIALKEKRGNGWQLLTYAELLEISFKTAGFLIGRGFNKGQCAVVISDNCVQWPAVFMGIMFSGMVCVPLDTQLSAPEIKNLLLDSAAKIIFSTEKIFAKKISVLVKELNLTVIIMDASVSCGTDCFELSAISQAAAKTSVFAQVTPDDAALMVYTSGTTSNPKAVVLSHNNICSKFSGISQLGIFRRDDNMLAILPLYHTYAITVTCLVPLLTGASVTFFNLELRPSELGKIIKEAGVTVIAGVPQFFVLLLKEIQKKLDSIPCGYLLAPLVVRLSGKKARSLRLMVSGGARLEPEIGKKLSSILGVKIIEGYGLTETSPIVSFNPPRKVKFGSVGKPVPGVQIKISSPVASGAGEVLIKGPNVMLGYFKRPQQTSEVVRDGWFYSGDLGYIDRDGYLFLTGRKNEMIVLASGKNIYPQELEEYYGSSHYIKEICVLGKIQRALGGYKEALYAVIVPNLEYFRSKNETDISGKIRWELENLSKDLPAYKHIMGFVLTKEELPRTALRKIKRHEVRDKYLGQAARETDHGASLGQKDIPPEINREVADKIISFLSSAFKRKINLQSHLEIDLGVDSLGRIELGMELERILGTRIPDEELSRVSSVEELIVAVSNFLSNPIGPSDNRGPASNWQQILRHPPKDNVMDKIALKDSLLGLLLRVFFKFIFLFIFRVFWLLRIKGQEHLPVKGPYLLCPNHASYLDGFFVYSSLNLNAAAQAFFLGYSQIIEHPSIKWATKLARLIPIDPGVNLIDAMQVSSWVLLNGKVICIFPEGKRSIDDKAGEFKKGVGILIKELNVPVIPVYIKNSHYSWPRGLRLPRLCPITVNFGRPFLLEELLTDNGKGQTDDYELIVRNLREEVLRLSC